MIRLPPNVKLKARERAVFAPRYVDGLTHEEIAPLVGVSRRAVADRDAQIRAAFLAAGHAEPRPPGRYAMRVCPLRTVAG